MISKKICVHSFSDTFFQNPDAFLKKIMKYDCTVTFKHNNIEGNAKSILSVLSVCANDGDEIEIICEGKDEKAALKATVDMLEDVQ